MLFNVRSLVYISIWLSIDFMSSMGLLSSFGFPLSLAVLAFFIPHFGFKRTLGIAYTAGLIELGNPTMAFQNVIVSMNEWFWIVIGLMGYVVAVYVWLKIFQYIYTKKKIYNRLLFEEP